MGRLVEVFVPGEPAPGGSKRAFVVNGRAVVKDDCRRNGPWRDRVASFAREAHPGPPLEGPLALTMTFVLARPKGHYGAGRHSGRVRPSAPAHPTVKPDTTKLVRAAEDALTGVLWRDDTQIVRQTAAKRYACPGEAPGLRLAVEEVA
jgi:Holliday junction resolvase RusA-like endonuclease